ncbi:hypothetical protein KEM48_011396 [Puccinia striiformis f. sp. tritici PST-130]|nr:hypothetical protein KEM48_011396 [Puccinia striiformis f. sp. tritici PST-130]
MRSIANRGHAPVESISAPAGVDVLCLVLRRGSILGSMMSSNSAQINDNQTWIDGNQAEIGFKSSSNRSKLSSNRSKPSSN